MKFSAKINDLTIGTKRDKTGHHPPVKRDMSQRHPKGGVGLSQTQVAAGMHKERRGEDVTYIQSARPDSSPRGTRPHSRPGDIIPYARIATNRPREMQRRSNAR